jgi:transcriptional regulator with XRE-family HTH domain
MARKRTEMGGPIEQAFGKRLKQLRRERGLSQEELATTSGCDRSYISLLERGVNSPSLTMLLQVSQALAVTASQLLTRVEADLTGADGSAVDRTSAE